MSLQLVNYIISKDAVGSMRNPALFGHSHKNGFFIKCYSAYIAESIVLY